MNGTFRRVIRVINFMTNMETIRRTTLSFIAGRRWVRTLVCLLVGISTIFGFLALCRFHDYEPWQIKIPKALGRTLEAHLGLWLATLEIKSRWRFLVAALLVPSGVGVYLLLWHQNLVTMIAAGVALIWLVRKVLRGERLDD